MGMVSHAYGKQTSDNNVSQYPLLSFHIIQFGILLSEFIPEANISITGIKLDLKQKYAEHLMAHQGQTGIKIAKYVILSNNVNDVQIQHAPMAAARQYRKYFVLLKTSFSDTDEVQSAPPLLSLIFFEMQDILQTVFYCILHCHLSEVCSPVTVSISSKRNQWNKMSRVPVPIMCIHQYAVSKKELQ